MVKLSLRRLRSQDIKNRKVDQAKLSSASTLPDDALQYLTRFKVRSVEHLVPSSSGQKEERDNKPSPKKIFKTVKSHYKKPINTFSHQPFRPHHTPIAAKSRYHFRTRKKPFKNKKYCLRGSDPDRIMRPYLDISSLRTKALLSCGVHDKSKQSKSSGTVPSAINKDDHTFDTDSDGDRTPEYPLKPGSRFSNRGYEQMLLGTTVARMEAKTKTSSEKSGGDSQMNSSTVGSKDSSSKSKAHLDMSNGYSPIAFKSSLKGRSVYTSSILSNSKCEVAERDSIPRQTSPPRPIRMRIRVKPPLNEPSAQQGGEVADAESLSKNSCTNSGEDVMQSNLKTNQAALSAVLRAFQKFDPSAMGGKAPKERCRNKSDDTTRQDNHLSNDSDTADRHHSLEDEPVCFASEREKTVSWQQSISIDQNSDAHNHNKVNPSSDSEEIQSDTDIDKRIKHHEDARRSSALLKNPLLLHYSIRTMCVDCCFRRRTIVALNLSYDEKVFEISRGQFNPTPCGKNCINNNDPASRRVCEKDIPLLTRGLTDISLANLCSAWTKLAPFEQPASSFRLSGASRTMLGAPGHPQIWEELEFTEEEYSLLTVMGCGNIDEPRYSIGSAAPECEHRELAPTRDVNRELEPMGDANSGLEPIGDANCELEQLGDANSELEPIAGASGRNNQASMQATQKTYSEAFLRLDNPADDITDIPRSNKDKENTSGRLEANREDDDPTELEIDSELPLLSENFMYVTNTSRGSSLERDSEYGDLPQLEKYVFDELVTDSLIAHVESSEEHLGEVAVAVNKLNNAPRVDGASDHLPKESSNEFNDSGIISSDRYPTEAVNMDVEYTGSLQLDSGSESSVAALVRNQNIAGGNRSALPGETIESDCILYSEGVPKAIDTHRGNVGAVDEETCLENCWASSHSSDPQDNITDNLVDPLVLGAETRVGENLEEEPTSGYGVSISPTSDGCKVTECTSLSHVAAVGASGKIVESTECTTTVSVLAESMPGVGESEIHHEDEHHPPRAMPDGSQVVACTSLDNVTSAGASDEFVESTESNTTVSALGESLSDVSQSGTHHGDEQQPHTESESSRNNQAQPQKRKSDTDLETSTPEHSTTLPPQHVASGQKCAPLPAVSSESDSVTRMTSRVSSLIKKAKFVYRPENENTDSRPLTNTDITPQDGTVPSQKEAIANEFGAHGKEKKRRLEDFNSRASSIEERQWNSSAGFSKSVDIHSPTPVSSKSPRPSNKRRPKVLPTDGQPSNDTVDGNQMFHHFVNINPAVQGQVKKRKRPIVKKSVQGQGVVFHLPPLLRAENIGNMTLFTPVSPSIAPSSSRLQCKPPKSSHNRRSKQRNAGVLNKQAPVPIAKQRRVEPPEFAVFGEMEVIRRPLDNEKPVTDPVNPNPAHSNGEIRGPNTSSDSCHISKILLPSITNTVLIGPFPRPTQIVTHFYQSTAPPSGTPMVLSSSSCARPEPHRLGVQSARPRNPIDLHPKPINAGQCMQIASQAPTVSPTFSSPETVQMQNALSSVNLTRSPANMGQEETQNLLNRPLDLTSSRSVAKNVTNFNKCVYKPLTPSALLSKSPPSHLISSSYDVSLQRPNFTTSSGTIRESMTHSSVVQATPQTTGMTTSTHTNISQSTSPRPSPSTGKVGGKLLEHYLISNPRFSKTGRNHTERKTDTVNVLESLCRAETSPNESFTSQGDSDSDERETHAAAASVCQEDNTATEGIAPSAPGGTKVLVSRASPISTMPSSAFKHLGPTNTCDAFPDHSQPVESFADQSQGKHDTKKCTDASQAHLLGAQLESASSPSSFVESLHDNEPESESRETVSNHEKGKSQPNSNLSPSVSNQDKCRSQQNWDVSPPSVLNQEKHRSVPNPDPSTSVSNYETGRSERPFDHSPPLIQGSDVPSIALPAHVRRPANHHNSSHTPPQAIRAHSTDINTSIIGDSTETHDRLRNSQISAYRKRVAAARFRKPALPVENFFKSAPKENSYSALMMAAITSKNRPPVPTECDDSLLGLLGPVSHPQNPRQVPVPEINGSVIDLTEDDDCEIVSVSIPITIQQESSTTQHEGSRLQQKLSTTQQESSTAQHEDSRLHQELSITQQNSSRTEKESGRSENSSHDITSLKPYVFNIDDDEENSSILDTQATTDYEVDIHLPRQGSRVSSRHEDSRLHQELSITQQNSSRTEKESGRSENSSHDITSLKPYVFNIDDDEENSSILDTQATTDYEVDIHLPRQGSRVSSRQNSPPHTYTPESIISNVSHSTSSTESWIDIRQPPSPTTNAIPRQFGIDQHSETDAHLEGHLGGNSFDQHPRFCKSDVFVSENTVPLPGEDEQSCKHQAETYGAKMTQGQTLPITGTIDGNVSLQHLYKIYPGPMKIPTVTHETFPPHHKPCNPSAAEETGKNHVCHKGEHSFSQRAATNDNTKSFPATSSHDTLMPRHAHPYSTLTAVTHGGVVSRNDNLNSSQATVSQGTLVPRHTHPNSSPSGVTHKILTGHHDDQNSSPATSNCQIPTVIEEALACQYNDPILNSVLAAPTHKTGPLPRKKRTKKNARMEEDGPRAPLNIPRDPHPTCEAQPDPHNNQPSNALDYRMDNIDHTDLSFALEEDQMYEERIYQIHGVISNDVNDAKDSVGQKLLELQKSRLQSQGIQNREPFQKKSETATSLIAKKKENSRKTSKTLHLDSVMRMNDTSLLPSDCVSRPVFCGKSVLTSFPILPPNTAVTDGHIVTTTCNRKQSSSEHIDDNTTVDNHHIVTTNCTKKHSSPEDFGKNPRTHIVDSIIQGRDFPESPQPHIYGSLRVSTEFDSCPTHTITTSTSELHVSLTTVTSSRPPSHYVTSPNDATPAQKLSSSLPHAVVHGLPTATVPPHNHNLNMSPSVMRLVQFRPQAPRFHHSGNVLSQHASTEYMRNISCEASKEPTSAENTRNISCEASKELTSTENTRNISCEASKEPASTENTRNISCEASKEPASTENTRNISCEASKEPTSTENTRNMSCEASKEPEKVKHFKKSSRNIQPLHCDDNQSTLQIGKEIRNLNPEENTEPTDHFSAEEGTEIITIPLRIKQAVADFYSKGGKNVHQEKDNEDKINSPSIDHEQSANEHAEMDSSGTDGVDKIAKLVSPNDKSKLAMITEIFASATKGNDQQFYLSDDSDQTDYPKRLKIVDFPTGRTEEAGTDDSGSTTDSDLDNVSALFKEFQSDKEKFLSQLSETHDEDGLVVLSVKSQGIELNRKGGKLHEEKSANKSTTSTGKEGFVRSESPTEIAKILMDLHRGDGLDHSH